MVFLVLFWTFPKFLFKIVPTMVEEYSVVVSTFAVSGVSKTSPTVNLDVV